MSSIFTAPASCSESWTFEPEVANSVQNGLLLQNAAASDNADPACFPSGYNHYGRVQASLVYSPGYCPGGYTSAELAAKSSTTAAICCPSAFSYYEEARGDSETFAGCLSRLPSGSSTSVTVRQNSTSTEVSGPITMWAQAIQIELQASDLSLFVSATTTPTTTTTSSDTSSVPTSSATASSTPTSSTAPSTGSSGMSTGAKIGVGVGVGAGGLIILVALVFWLFRRRQNNQKKTLADAPSSFGGSRTAPSELGADGFGASPSYQRGGYVTPSELGSEPAGSTSKNANTTPSELYAAPPGPKFVHELGA
ncbi:hypothetical protein CBS147325_7574 [Penicillium roqueforti]|nr:hypothetical protein CBS147325_7574 [Penicillium roqueforti]KAI3168297.1 hypothetical protein DTO046C5_4555 [Penicillium roqueforti]